MDILCDTLENSFYKPTELPLGIFLQENSSNIRSKIYIFILNGNIQIETECVVCFQQIPHRISNQNQQEILQLLCRVHQLEIENLEAKSISLLRDFQIKKKDMVITRFKHHRNLCADIIKQQQQIIEGKLCHTTSMLNYIKGVILCSTLFLITSDFGVTL